MAVPDFAEPGQFSAPCVWIPPRPGSVAITATVTYRVEFVVSGPGNPGLRDVLAPYVWSSAPFTARVDELRSVNVKWDKGTGG